MKSLLIISCLILYTAAQQMVIQVEQNVDTGNCGCGGCGNGNVEPEPEPESGSGPEPEPEPEPEAEPEPEPEAESTQTSLTAEPDSTTESQAESIPACPIENPNWVEYQNYCYYHSEDPKTWGEVEALCQELGSHVGFFYPLDPGMDNTIVTEVLNGVTINHWIGIHAVGMEWKTYQGNAPEYIVSSESPMGCVSLGLVAFSFLPTINYEGDDCSQGKGYICGYSTA